LANNEKQEKSNNVTDLIKVKQAKEARNIMKKWLTKTSFTILLIGIIIATFIGINFWVEKVNPIDLDFTKDKVYSISEASKALIESVESNVEIILINMNNTARSVVDFAHKYNHVNEKIKVTEVDDISKEPELANKYNLTDTSIMIIMQSGEKDKVLSLNNLYTWDYTTGEQKDITEEAMTNAILDITVTEKPKIYYLTNHAKYSLDYMTYFIQDLANEANEVETLDLLVKGEIPEDASALIITTLTEDITKPEREAILKYIKKGGKIIIFSDPNVGKLKLPNFQKVLDQYGVGISEGIMLEQDSSKMLSGAPSAILVTVTPSSSISSQTNMNISACLMNAGKLSFKSAEELEKLKVQVETLATTSETSFYRSDLNIEEITIQDKDEEGYQTVGALLTKKINDDTISKLIIYSNNMFITNVPIAINTEYYLYALDFYHNVDLALNSIAYLTGRDDTITIRKNTETTTYTVTQQQQNIVLTIIFTVPAVIIFIGIVVWQVRRRKK